MMTGRLCKSTDIEFKLLLAEHNVLYRLAEYRLASLDRRTPIATATLTAFLSSVPALPGASQIILLIFLPVTLIWLLRTTINHAKAFEDAARRIEEIEYHANGLAGHELMRFQSSHPSRSTPGGRTASDAIQAVAAGSALILATALVVFPGDGSVSQLPRLLYPLYIAIVALVLLLETSRLRSYRYLSVRSA